MQHQGCFKAHAATSNMASATINYFLTSCSWLSVIFKKERNGMVEKISYEAGKIESKQFFSKFKIRFRFIRSPDGQTIINALRSFRLPLGLSNGQILSKYGLLQTFHFIINSALFPA